MKRTFVFAFCAGCTFAIGQVTPIGPFSGQLHDGFETQVRLEFHPQYAMFGGAGTVNQVGAGQGLHITTAWEFFFFMYPHSGEVFMGGADCNYEYVFDVPALRFGGYFGTNADAPGAVASFFDVFNNQIGPPMDVGAPLAQWQWNGWEYAGGIKRVQIMASNSRGGFIMSDDLEYDAVPEPASLVVLGFGLAFASRLRRR